MFYWCTLGVCSREKLKDVGNTSMGTCQKVEKIETNVVAFPCWIKDATEENINLYSSFIM